MGDDTDPTQQADATVDADAAAVRVYWRPGCGFCMILQRRLQRAGLATEDLNIWDDPDAAAFVRRHANGNETVPTVDIAGTVLVNPPAETVLARAVEAGIECTAPPPRASVADRVRSAFSGRHGEA